MEMSKVLKESESRYHKLQHFTIGEKDFYEKVRCGIHSGEYVRLLYRGECVMSDTPMERRTNSNFINNAHGDVLIGGLGIGMVLMDIQDKEEVKSITVVEKYRDVLDIVGKQLPINSKVRLVFGDVFEYVPQQKFNTIYMDIWNYINTDVYEKSMKPLISRYRKFLVPKSEDENRYIDCWCKNEAKRGIRI